MNPFPDVSITADGTTLTATAGDGYQWYFGGQEISNATDQTFEYNILEYGLYAVEVTENGCAAISDEFVYLITGEENDLDGLKVYPNPVALDMLFIETSQDLKISMYDESGKKMSEAFVLKDKINELQTNHLSEGIYLLVLKKVGWMHNVKIQKSNDLKRFLKFIYYITIMNCTFEFFNCK
jgi:hypothetical protein